MKISQTKNFGLVARLSKPVQDLHFSLYPMHFNQYNCEEVKEFFEKLMENKNDIFLLLEDDGEAVGYTWIEIKEYKVNPFKKAYKSIYVHQISIDDMKRNKGYGTSLMKYIYNLSYEKGIDLVELDYWVENKVAKEFYKKNNFVKYREFVYKQL